MKVQTMGISESNMCPHFMYIVQKKTKELFVIKLVASSCNASFYILQCCSNRNNSYIAEIAGETNK